MLTHGRVDLIITDFHLMVTHQTGRELRIITAIVSLLSSGRLCSEQINHKLTKINNCSMRPVLGIQRLHKWSLSDNAMVDWDRQLRCWVACPFHFFSQVSTICGSNFGSRPCRAMVAVQDRDRGIFHSINGHWSWYFAHEVVNYMIAITN